MLILEIASGTIIAVFVLLFLAYWIAAGLTGGDGAGYCCMIALAVGAWFFSTAIGIAITALMGGLFVLLALHTWANNKWPSKG